MGFGRMFLKHLISIVSFKHFMCTVCKPFHDECLKKLA